MERLSVCVCDTMLQSGGQYASVPMTPAYSSSSSYTAWRAYGSSFQQRGTSEQGAAGTYGQAQQEQKRPRLFAMANPLSNLGKQLRGMSVWLHGSWTLACFALFWAVFGYWVQIAGSGKDTHRVYALAYYMTNDLTTLQVDSTSVVVQMNHSLTTECGDEPTNACLVQYLPQPHPFLDKRYDMHTGVLFGANNIFLWLLQIVYLTFVFALAQYSQKVDWLQSEKPKYGMYALVLLMGAMPIIFFVCPNTHVPITSLALCIGLDLVAAWGVGKYTSQDSIKGPSASDATVLKYKDAYHEKLIPAVGLWNQNKLFWGIAGTKGSLSQEEKEVNFRHLEFSLTAGLFLVATIFVSDMTADVYVYQQAFFGMVMCNAIAWCLISHANKTDNESQMNLQQTLVFLAATMCFIAGVLPAFALSVGPLLTDQGNNVPVIVKVVVVYLIASYCLFAFVGMLFFVIFPALKTTSSTMEFVIFSSLKTTFSTMDSKWRNEKLVWVYFFLNFICKFGIIVILLAGALQQVGLQ